ncbi:hypothetical protein TNCV_4874381 [Trichonephila clavipes]|nr:hypothetical protein TNCV_4874381 [Trichonephila clavipes]
MPNSPSQMIPDMLYWRQIWGSGRPRKGGNSAETVLRHPCCSNFLVRGLNLNGGVGGWASRAAHVMGATIPNLPQPGAFVWFEKKQGP